MQKFLIPVLIILVVVAGASGYFFGQKNGMSRGRTDLQNELSAEKEIYKKSQEAVKDAANKFLSAYKYRDYEELYTLTCADFKTKADVPTATEAFRDFQSGFTVQDFTIDDVIVSGGTAKVRYTEIRNRALSNDTKVPQKVSYKFEDDKWCVDFSNS